MGQVRIIAGNLRGRKIQFPDNTGIRPTKDFIREKVFNWLQTSLHGQIIVDMFAGSGAWGFEALSRGAKFVYFVEKDGKNCSNLIANASKFGVSDKVSVVQADAVAYSKNLPKNTSFITLDPPFASNICEEMLENIKNSSNLAENALIYLELPKEHTLKLENIHKSATTGAVSYYLVKI